MIICIQNYNLVGGKKRRHFIRNIISNFYQNFFFKNMICFIIIILTFKIFKQV